MPSVVGSLFFEVYKNGKLVKNPSEAIPRAFDDWLNEFESPILDHVFENGVFSSTRDTGMSVSFIDRIEYIKASSENPALPADINVGDYKVTFTKFLTPDQEADELEAESNRMMLEIQRINAETASRRAQNIARANAAAGPIGAGAGPAPAQPAAPARRRPVSEDPENVEDEDPKQGGRKRTKKNKRRAKKRRYTRRR
jgi:hypothetical protein